MKKTLTVCTFLLTFTACSVEIPGIPDIENLDDPELFDCFSIRVNDCLNPDDPHQTHTWYYEWVCSTRDECETRAIKLTAAHECQRFSGFTRKTDCENSNVLECIFIQLVCPTIDPGDAGFDCKVPDKSFTLCDR